MAFDGSVAGRKRRSSRAVIGGMAMIVMALLIDPQHVLPPLVTTLAAIVGFGAVMYGVHLGWQVFYDREPPGSSS